jgi:hypothetical protein
LRIDIGFRPVSTHPRSTCQNVGSGHARPSEVSNSQTAWASTRSAEPKLAFDRIDSPAQFVVFCAKLTDLAQVTFFTRCPATHLVVLPLDPLAFSALRVRVVDVVAPRPVLDGVDIGHTATV